MPCAIIDFGSDERMNKHIAMYLSFIQNIKLYEKRSEEDGGRHIYIVRADG